MFREARIAKYRNTRRNSLGMAKLNLIRVGCISGFKTWPQGIDCIIHVDYSLCRIREGRHQHNLTFKSVAKGTISKGYLDPTDGKHTKGIL